MNVRWIYLPLALVVATAPVLSRSGHAQTQTLKSPTPIAASAATSVPALVPYSGIIEGRESKAVSSGITFLIYKDELGGEPLFTETQTVAIDPTGHYKVQLGASQPSGIPVELFANGEARWLEVQIVGEKPQPRTLLASVPYALKAADAATLGGLPASAFALAGTAGTSSNSTSASITRDGITAVTTTGGTANNLAVFSGASTVINSILIDNGVGIGVGKPPSASAILDVNGPTILRGDVQVQRTGNATPSTGYNSHQFNFTAQAWDSSTNGVVNPTFQWRAEPAGNNTASPSATWNLLTSNGVANAAETGLYVNGNGTFHFATGQTFPGTGAGTITGVSAGSGLTGGGTSGNVTLNIDATKVPLLAANNSFTGNQAIHGTETVSGSLSVGASLLLPNTSSASVGVVQLGTTPFLSNYGPANGGNAFIGGAGNFKATGTDNTGTGLEALNGATSGVANTADGAFSLIAETTGTANTGIGYDSVRNTTTGSYNAGLGYGAAFYNTTGSYNTGIGSLAGVASGATALSNTTAIGANATVSQNNTLVLGNTTTTPGAEFVNVGVGTSTPISAMELSVSANGAVGPVLTLTNPGGNSNSGPGEAAAAIDFNTVPVASSGYLPGARIEAVDDGSGLADLEFLTDSVNVLQSDMKIFNNGEVFISSSEGASLTVLGAQAESVSVEALAANNNDGFYGAGGDANGSTTGGNGGDFYGGNATTGTGGYGIYAAPGFSNGTNGKAALLDGNVQVNGTLSADLKQFKIDDPIDPANKYLIHSSIESSEMVNIYSGNVTTDELGLATVKLPNWFEAANGDFRYQLTVVGGQFAQAIVSKEIHDHEFTISTNMSRVKVSWQVTGVRQDAYAKAHPMAAEEAKDEHERGFYIHPELYGQPKEKQIEWGRRPEAMQLQTAQREKAKLALKTAASPMQRSQSVAPASAVNRTFNHPTPQIDTIGRPGNHPTTRATTTPILKPISTTKP